MRLILIAASCFGLFVMGAVAQQPATTASDSKSFSGMLVDASCKVSDTSSSAQSQSSTQSETRKETQARSSSAAHGCEVATTTNNFGLLMNNKVYSLDANGNTLAARELKNSGKMGKVNVSITGKMEGNTLQVESLQVR